MARVGSWFRPVAVGAGVLLVIGNVMSLGRPEKFSDAAKTPLFELSSVLLLVGGFALLAAIVAMQVWQGDQAGECKESADESPAGTDR
jgi:hypothetical protein